MTIAPDSASPRCLACNAGNLRFHAKARDVEYYSTNDIFTYNLCPECGALSIDPVPEDRLAQIYPAGYYSFAGHAESLAEKIKQALDRRLFRRLFRMIDPENRRKEFSALDIGGGSGWLLGQAKSVEPRLGKTVVVDIDDKAEALAVAAGHRYFLGRIEDFVTEEKFDLILMLNLIEHVKDPVGMLRKAGAMLAPGGRILIKTPNHDSLDERIFRHRNWGGYHCPRHWVLFTPESFQIAADRAGVGVESLTLTQGAPFWTWSVLHMLKNMGLIDISAEKPAYRHPLAPFLTLGFAAFDFLRRPFMRTSQMFIILKNKDLK
jgi:SAM-dependent methyltransferase